MNLPLSWKASQSSLSLSSSSVFRRYVIAVLALLPLVVVVVDAGALLGKKRLEKDNPQARSIGISNMSGRKCDLYWVNVFTKPEQFVPQFVEDGVSVGISYGADKSISSYIGHQFELRELPSKRTKQCIFEECRSVRIKVSDREDQKVTIERDFTFTIQDDHERSYSKADDMFTRCQTKVNNDDELSPLDFIDAVTKCMEDEVNEKLMKVQEERSFQSKLHRGMASDLVPFTCGDVNQTQSREILNSTWRHNDDEYEYKIRKLHELPTSTIFIVDDFVTKDYCDALKVYRNDDNGDDKHVPLSAAFEGTKQSDLLKALLNKMYELVMDRMDWDDLNVDGNILFKYMKDEIGLDTPTHLCNGAEEVAKAFADIEAGKPKTCQIPGGDPVMVSTKRIHMDDVEKKDDSKEEEEQKRQLADVFLFCDEPEKKILGGLHFPYARIYITPKPGKLVVAVNRNAGVETNELDGYVNEYHLCPNHEVYVHTVSESVSVSEGGVAAAVLGKDEGEL